MADRWSRDVRTILKQADQVARASGRPTTSVHLVAAMLIVNCPARELLFEAGVDDTRLLDTLERMTEREDSAEALEEIYAQAVQLADSTGSPEVSSVILLASVLRVRNALALKTLERAGVHATALRARAIGLVNLQNDRATTGTRPALRGGDDRGPSRTDLPRVGSTTSQPPIPQPISRPTAPRPPAPIAAPHVPRPPAPLHQPLRAVTPAQATATPTNGGDQPGEPANKPQSLTNQGQGKAGTSKGVRRDLDPAQYPALCELGRNLSAAALRGEIDAVFGRDDLIDQIIDVLMMRQTNNPCLVGPAGVGKTAIAEGLAHRLATQPERYGRLGDAILVEIPVSALLAGTALRGAFSERMRKLRDEVAKADGGVIIFMDEIHTLMGAGTGDGPLDAANDLKSALARGKFPLIGATTQAEFERHILKDPAMERRFQLVPVAEPTVPQAIQILAGVAPVYARHHGVPYSHDAVQSAVYLSHRFITDQSLPHKAISILDRAGAQARRAGKTVVQADDVARAVHGLTQVPMERLLADERGRIRDLAQELQGLVIGHDALMLRIARRIQRNYAGFSGDRPVASLLFVGAPGSGKTETARALAQCLFIADDSLQRFDMTEYSEAHTLSRLIGSPPGYVGHGQQGVLAQALQKRPYRVLLFDEIDRAAPEVIAFLLQLLDTGRVTDAQGHIIDARNCIVILTANLGADLLAAGARRKPIGFGADMPAATSTSGDSAASDAVVAAVVDKARAALPQDFFSRIDDVLVFQPLSRQSAQVIVARALRKSAERLYQARLIRFEADAAVVDLVLGPGLDPALGIRPLRARIESLVEAFVSDRVLDGDLQPGAEMQLTVVDGALALRPLQSGQPPIIPDILST